MGLQCPLGRIHRVSRSVRHSNGDYSGIYLAEKRLMTYHTNLLLPGAISHTLHYNNFIKAYDFASCYAKVFVVLFYENSNKRKFEETINVDIYQQMSPLQHYTAEIISIQ